MDLEIKNFDLNKINTGVSLLFGATKSGKTIFINNLIEHLYKKSIKTFIIKEDYDYFNLRDIIDEQMYNKDIKTIAIIFDNINTINNDLYHIMENSKNLDIICIIVCNNILINDIGNCIERIMILNVQNDEYKKQIYNTYLKKYIEDEEMFDTIYEECTKNYEMLIFDKNDNITYWYKSELKEDDNSDNSDEEEYNEYISCFDFEWLYDYYRVFICL